MKPILSFGYFSANVKLEVEFDDGETDVKKNPEEFSCILNRIDNGLYRGAKDGNPKRKLEIIN